ncbi:phytanoyl-CoA dioxygenase family protein [Gammaproteobacteria bacterium]|jgi:hypothetical protein|nr:phytanoyl-CoA dioxygenase family protein [Gammaproteobacteria bacterium]
MNIGYKLIGKCLQEDYCQNLFNKINSTYEEHLKNSEKLAGGISGHLNCVLGEESSIILEHLQEYNGMKEMANFFQIDLDEYHVSVGCNVNLPGSKLQHIHYDGDYDEESFILNIPLIDTTKMNGAIKIIPESHTVKRSYLGYILSGISKKTLQIESNQGHGLIRSSNAWHRGTPNRTNVIRPMLNIVLYKIDSPYSKDAIKDDLEYSKGKIRFRDNWYLATSLPRRLQEYAYVYFPFFHSFTRVIKSLFRTKDIL